MIKWDLIILATILGIVLGSIIEGEVCKVSEQNLGTATGIVKLTCFILSIPIEIIILILTLYQLFI
ncbi:MAG: hypothetical protein AABX45_02710 [Nanoarchaeota archaeon]